jgi:hypothetical protein
MMDSTESKKTNSKEQSDRRATYEAPAIIYEGVITTRAGSPVFSPEGDGVDPADLFGS